MHTRASYRVGYYSLHTGTVEPTVITDPDNPEHGSTVLRLIHAIEVHTCVHCYQQPSVRGECERLFRPELEAQEPG